MRWCRTVHLAHVGPRQSGALCMCNHRWHPHLLKLHPSPREWVLPGEQAGTAAQPMPGIQGAERRASRLRGELPATLATGHLWGQTWIPSGVTGLPAPVGFRGQTHTHTRLGRGPSAVK